MLINLGKAAELLGTSESMLLRWIRQGVVPAHEINGEFQFDERTLESWAEKRHFITKHPLHDSNRPQSREAVSLLNAMKRGGVHFGIVGHTVSEVLESSLDKLVLPDELTKGELFHQLLEREALASTGIGKGVAVPHPRHPLGNTPHSGMIGTFFLENPVDFDAIDGEPVYVLFLMLSPNTKKHLKLLSQLTFCLHDAAFRKELSECQNEECLLNRIGQMSVKFETDARSRSAKHT